MIVLTLAAGSHMWGLEIVVIFSTNQDLPRKGRNNQVMKTDF